VNVYPSPRYAILAREFLEVFDKLLEELNQYVEADERISRDAVALAAAVLVAADCVLEAST
jgi:hypothetical protein